MSHDHSHAAPEGPGSEKRLIATLAITALFLVVEVIASFATGSLALLSDAGHMGTDVAGLAIALLAIRIGKRTADAQRTFGYRRLEILAAALNSSALFVVAAYVFYEAIGRFMHPEPVASTGMLIVAAAGLVINGIGMWLLRGGEQSSLNVKGAYLEVWADFLGSIAVLIAAVLIRVTGARWIDPLVAIGIALWVLPRGWTLLRSALHVLLEAVPEGIDVKAIERTLLALPGVKSIHDLHVWSVTTGVPLLSCHLHVERLDTWEDTLRAACDAIEDKHGIHHLTLQPEQDRACLMQEEGLVCKT